MDNRVNIMKPTIGRIVIYKTTEAEQQTMEDSTNQNVQKELPAIIVAVWSESTVNLKVILDGAGELWKTSATKGESEGNWDFPVIK